VIETPVRAIRRNDYPYERETNMPDLKALTRLTSLAPQFLVDDLARSIAFYQKLGFVFGAPWEGFYAIGERDGLELHLKEAPKNPAEREYRRTHEHSTRRPGWTASRRFTRSASPTTSRFCSR